MMVEKEDLGLSLSLGCSGSITSDLGNCGGVNRSLHLRHPPLELNLMPSLFVANRCLDSAAHRNPWSDSFGSAADRTLEEQSKALGGGVGMGSGEPRSFLKGIDVNRLPASGAEDDEARVSSPNSTISSISGKRSERETTFGPGDDLDTDRACSRGISDEDDGETSRKKLRLSKDQSAIIEESFKAHNTLNPKQKLALAKRLGLRPRQVEVWFQNRRARTKLKQTEVDCELLKRCCEQLTEENRRLQKEVHELRALKFSPKFYMPMTPPTTLTMCPSCERLGPPPSGSASSQVNARPSHGIAHQRRSPMNPWGGPTGQLEALRS